MQMLKNWNPEQIPEKEDIKVRLSAARTRLYELQMALKEHKIPVIVLFEGWGASGKGSTAKGSSCARWNRSSSQEVPPHV